MRPTPQCRVKIRTKGQLENGTVVDKYHSVPFTLGDGDVIQGVEFPLKHVRPHCIYLTIVHSI